MKENECLDDLLKKVTLIGLIFLGIGVLFLFALMSTLLRFAVGGSANPPLRSPLGELLSTLVGISSVAWIIFVLLGLVLMIAGFLRKASSRSNVKRVRTQL